MRKRSAAIGSAVFLVVGPGTVLGLIPWLLTDWELRDPKPFWAPLPVQILGVALLLAGVVVVVHAFVRFVAEGLGTPVPSAPPQHLVVGGFYRFVRNPMYVAVLGGIVGQALLLGQWNLLVYTVIVWAVTATFVRWREEPVLARRFGPAYDTYRRAVRAWWPRLRPWDSSQLAGTPVTGTRREYG